MKLRVLGCHGGELPTCKSTCFLVDDVLALDAGALTGTLSLEELCRVDHVLVGHSHFDHVKDLPLMADLVIGRRDKPVTIHASRECAKALRDNMFNNALWPDFTRIPTKANPVLRIKTFRAGGTFEVGPYTVRSVPVSHPVESCGFIISNGKTSLAMSGDTGPTDKLWKALNQTRDLKALLLETSFPNALQSLADISGHLTPHTLGLELQKFERNGTSVMLYHLKPAFVAQLKKELASMPVEVLELNDTFEF
ncbi:3',5'-cyclic-nucleotide phosphodiesterase [Myxococcus sp. CA051A]|uniref:3',5'-cyclic-nucleotide phosphodiesterase n=1 Tax=Myxococcus llanfairpwllgwyngyllgogerychwyrndrobwllllantysiliogogogochensis TaxID=2590453 RepID=A0A540WLU3_9BACT|nr:3',5'-cyclic-nucleotide phosphodiesterase [Myxococcus llanfairpwllgwyngyllgogerychwyrndrobwllllantysiliogogogochensis]NTX03996.1 3',5'-cyclic-nucleotide phosphodiesterase [Myxococcus sp. CA040A]NTX13392.1 3',5'-cyclic-nucleotide phosphodiesterase [Myxococcus sp. CA056]NTX35748.1 3',5'-cyclic-nucleotide phosphodiesterase [Myxococcus sp. CA033]NTX55331.1 3',5'-cyclic-nucleotide phosphodiesterase [Myxococcus sp. CA039A]NTX61850.1 3',5'-cyclic-nucleotide phosphodiesterase [Myxococcus sp. CA051A